MVIVFPSSVAGLTPVWGQATLNVIDVNIACELAHLPYGLT
jgi:hypothetical protein